MAVDGAVETFLTKGRTVAHLKVVEAGRRGETPVDQRRRVLNAGDVARAGITGVAVVT